VAEVVVDLPITLDQEMVVVVDQVVAEMVLTQEP
jgi:hypothetical protein|tara:strand:- start:2 stop:103 length:102 start_codon:yes stop_codon:yes gene_type:complete